MGILFKLLYPEMPFILRIGYVFIVLSFVMIGISLFDRKHIVENITQENSAKKAGLGIRIIVIAMLIGTVVAFFVKQFRDFALDAVYVLIAGFILLGLIILFNNSQKKMNVRGIIISDGIFHTTATFNIAAIGVVGILAMLYTVFW